MPREDVGRGELQPGVEVIAGRVEEFIEYATQREH